MSALRDNVLDTGAWGVDARLINRELVEFKVTGAPPPWAVEVSDLLASVADAIECGSPEARQWAIAQLRTAAEAFGPDCSSPKGV